MGAPHVRAIKGYRKLWELRVQTRQAIRLFYFAHTGRRFIILHGFVKKRGRTPPRELETAMRRMRDVLAREEYDHD